MSDGYFLLTALDPDSQGIGGNAGGYSSGQDAVLGIQPRKAGGETMRVDPVLIFDSAISCAYAASGNQQQQSTGPLQLGGTLIYNGTGRDITIDVAFKIVPNDDPDTATPIYLSDINSQVSQTQTISLTNYQVRSCYGIGTPYATKAKLDALNLAAGTYRVSIASRFHEPQSDWYDALHPFYLPGYGLLTVSETTTTKGHTTTTTRSYSATDAAIQELTVTNASHEGQWMIYTKDRISYTVTNNGSGETFANITPILVKATTSGNSLVAQGSCLSFDMLPGESQDVETSFSFAWDDDSYIGQSCNMWLYNLDTNYRYADLGTVTLKNYAAPTMSGTISVNGGNTVNDLRHIPISGSVSCSSGYFGDQLQLAIATNDGTIIDQMPIPAITTISSGANAQPYAVTYDFAEKGSGGGTYIAGLFQPYLAFDSDGYGSWAFNNLAATRFSTSQTSGLENVDSAGSDNLIIAYLPGYQTAIVQAPDGAEVVSVEAFSLDGKRLSLPVTFGGATATVSLADSASGLLILRAADSQGRSRASKLSR